MSSNPYDIYRNIQKEGMSQRELEASILTKAGIMLKRCQDNWNSPDRNACLEEAVKYNQKVWSFFQSELSMPDNPMPKNLREDILNLSLFLDKRLYEVLACPDPQKLTIAININLNLAAGLSTRPGQQQDMLEKAV